MDCANVFLCSLRNVSHWPDLSADFFTSQIAGFSSGSARYSSRVRWMKKAAMSVCGACLPPWWIPTRSPNRSIARLRGSSWMSDSFTHGGLATIRSTLCSDSSFGAAMLTAYHVQTEFPSSSMASSSASRASSRPLRSAVSSAPSTGAGTGVFCMAALTTRPMSSAKLDRRTKLIGSRISRLFGVTIRIAPLTSNSLVGSSSVISASPIRIWMAASPIVGAVGNTRIRFVFAISTATGWTSMPCTRLAVMSARCTGLSSFISGASRMRRAAWYRNVPDPQVGSSTPSPSSRVPVRPADSARSTAFVRQASSSASRTISAASQSGV